MSVMVNINGRILDQEHGDVDATLKHRARHDKPVAAIIAVTAQYGHVAFEQIAVDRLDGRHDLAAGVLHQHERGDADLLDRAAIRLAHLG